ncbi:MAG: DnaJ domain-containing protein [Polyangiales bacterium]
MDASQPKPTQGPLTAEERALVEATYRRLGGDCYEILGVSRSVDAVALRAAYYDLAKRFHPDLFSQRDVGRLLPFIEAIFREITAAFEQLSRPEARAAYDARLAAQAPTPSRAPAPAPTASRAPTPAPFTSRAPTPAPHISRAPTPNYLELARQGAPHPLNQAPPGTAPSPPVGTRRPTPTPPEPRATRSAAPLQRRGGPITPQPAMLDAATRERLADACRNDDALERLVTNARNAERSGRWEAAGEAWEKLSKLRPDDHGPLLLAAHAYAEASEDLSRAVDLARRAAKLRADDVSVQVALARLYFRAGRTASARGAVEAALRIDPNHPEAVSLSLKLR